MDTTSTVLVALLAVFVLLYALRRRARVKREDED